jgi:vacuolar-type H+-ATPase subunit F/Vma7
MYAQNELLYPHYVTAELRDMRGPEWRALVDHVLELPESHEEVLAFSLMMIRLNGCMACETDSYRAMRGCLACAAQTLRRYKGPDRDLICVYEQALSDIRKRLAEMKPLAASPTFIPVTEVA